MQNKRRDKLKKLGIISIVIFAFITSLSMLFFKNCNFSTYCNLTFITMIHVFIVSSGIIGLIYCFFILRDFDKVDKNILQNYNKIMLSDDKID